MATSAARWSVSFACAVLLSLAVNAGGASAAAWTHGVELTPPPNASTSVLGANPTSISCASAGNCSAVGDYKDSSNHQQGLLMSETSGTWAAAVEAVLPADAPYRFTNASEQPARTAIDQHPSHDGGRRGRHVVGELAVLRFAGLTPIPGHRVSDDSRPPPA